jgi:hypothetical protein
MLDAIYNRLFAPSMPVKIQAMGVFPESANLEERRAAVIARMKELGRTPVNEGGEFTRKLTVLKQEGQTTPCH